MGKSTNGPDEVDVMAMMSAMSALHSGHVEVLLRLGGIGFGLLAEVVCQMHFTALPGSSLPAVVEVKSVYPCPEHRTMWAHVYDGLYKLDFEVSKVYKNEALWKE